MHHIILNNYPHVLIIYNKLKNSIPIEARVYFIRACIDILVEWKKYKSISYKNIIKKNMWNKYGNNLIKKNTSIRDSVQLLIDTFNLIKINNLSLSHIMYGKKFTITMTKDKLDNIIRNINNLHPSCELTILHNYNLKKKDNTCENITEWLKRQDVNEIKIYRQDNDYFLDFLDILVQHFNANKT